MNETAYKPEDLMTAAQAAKQLKVHFTTLYRWMRAGKFKLVKYGEQDFLLKAEVEARTKASL